MNWSKISTIRYCLLIGFCLLSVSIGAQFSDQFDPSNREQTITEVSDTSETKRNSFLDIFYGKPGKAAFYSLIIPGGGQYYNKRYWKVPIIVGGEAFAFYWLFSRNSRYNEWNDAYLGLLNDEIESYQGVTTNDRAKSIRDSFLKQREYAYIIVIVTHLFNVFEAFIDRHLIDFDTSDDLSYQAPFEFKVVSNPMPSFALTIPLNRNKKQEKLLSYFGD